MVLTAFDGHFRNTALGMLSRLCGTIVCQTHFYDAGAFALTAHRIQFHSLPQTLPFQEKQTVVAGRIPTGKQAKRQDYRISRIILTILLSCPILCGLPLCGANSPASKPLHREKFLVDVFSPEEYSLNNSPAPTREKPLNVLFRASSMDTLVGLRVVFLDKELDGQGR